MDHSLIPLLLTKATETIAHNKPLTATEVKKESPPTMQFTWVTTPGNRHWPVIPGLNMLGLHFGCQ